MIALTTPIAVPNITRIACVSCATDEESSEAVVVLELRSPGGSDRLYRRARLVVRNGPSTGLALAATPSRYDDLVADVVVTTPTGFDQVLAAYLSGGGRAARLRAVESALLATGVLAAALGGTVS